ncbi:scavenger mRNA decapping enzyme [Mycena metata]|uniref:Scavenger mRNA decapping enzyme n=1 Tax=Mycena metata TaxID=1033252 RepID=A0AAD7NH25_9AGAR|nr:scavenger mRNA decapping enzyme [Mycena metata]
MQEPKDTNDIALSSLQGFVFERILLEEPEKCRLTVLGTFPASFVEHSEESTEKSTDALPAIVRLERTAIPINISQRIFPGQLGAFLSQVQCMERTDIYMWLAGWLSPSSIEQQPQGDVKVNIVCPATEVHIRKYSEQSCVLVHETPDIYRRIVEPYISGLPAERTRWRVFRGHVAVTEILDGHKEQSKLLFSSSDFIILPDMKWDLHTVGSLYLIAIVRDNSIRSIRDLRVRHIALLKSIQREAIAVASEKWGVLQGGLRMYMHYQPSYYHFHVHIVNANYEAGLGSRVGQAHLLDDVIALLELDEADASDRPGIFERITLTYAMKAAQT